VTASRLPADASDESVARELAETLSQLTSSSRASLIMVAVGVITLGASVYYSFTRLQPLEDEIARKRGEVAALNEQAMDAQRLVDQAKQEHAALKQNIEQLYAVRVTASNAVYEVKSTARATGRNTASGPEYKFTVLINAPADVLQAIEHVEYTFDHSTFRDRTVVADKASDQFAYSYVGWGCLTRVGVNVVLDDGSRQPFNFDMCRSLGPSWSGADDGRTADVPSKLSIDKRRIEKQAPVR
jgi:hypothetical protein